jgi:Uncharacterized ArCR, COG1888.
MSPAAVKRLVLDVLNHYDPPLVPFVRQVTEVDGDALNDEAVEERVEALGGMIHSVDHVVCGGQRARERRE